MDLCDDGNILFFKKKLLKIGNFIRVEAKTCDDITKDDCNRVDMKMEGGKLMQFKRILKSFPKPIDYLICPENPTFHEQNNVQGKKSFQSLKENSTNLNFLGRKETSVTAASITAKSLELKYSCVFME